MNIFQSIVMGLVEGFTEFLPVSSTAHQEIAAKLLNLPQTDFVKSFEVIIQFGAILAVLVFFGGKLWRNRAEWPKIIAAFVPTAIIGFVLYKIIKHFFLGNDLLAAIMLIVGGALMIWFERILAKKAKGSASAERSAEAMTNKEAAIIGAVQSLAVVPGVSRSAATIYAGLFQGFSRESVVEFSFMLAIPTMAAASGYDLLKDHSILSSGGFGILAAGFVAAFLSALVAIRFFLEYVRKYDFTSFGIYRIIIGFVYLALIFWR